MWLPSWSISVANTIFAYLHDFKFAWPAPKNIFNNDNSYNCKYYINCKVCTGKCRIFQPISCKERDKNIGACNGCTKLKSCKLDKYFYRAEEAQKKYEYTLRDSRQGVNLNTSELIELAHIICPLIKKRTINIYNFK